MSSVIDYEKYFLKQAFLIVFPQNDPNFTYFSYSSDLFLIVSRSRYINRLCRFPDILQLAFRFQSADLAAGHALSKAAK